MINTDLIRTEGLKAMSGQIRTDGNPTHMAMLINAVYGTTWKNNFLLDKM